MEANHSSWYNLSRTADTQIPSTSAASSLNGTSSLGGPRFLSAVRTQSAFRLRSNSTAMTVNSSTLYARTIANPTSSSYPVSSTSALIAPSSSTPTQIPSRLSPSAAMGIGVAAGVISIIIVLTAALFIYRCWKVRQSPTVRYYEQARLWKGFTPATPSTARTTFVGSKMANIYFTELRSPATPAFTLSPPLDGHGLSWPVTPDTTKPPPTELPV